VGVVQEVLSPAPDEKVGDRVNGVSINYNAIGVSDRNNNDSIKYLRDALLIEKELQKDNSLTLKSRYQFYLAQSYRDHGDLDRAVIAYEKRFGMTEGYRQERYISAIEAGRIYKLNQETVAKSMWSFLRATEIEPTRAEAHFQIAVLAREMLMWHTAIEHARLARRMKPEDGSLVMDEAVYEWKAAFEVSVAAFYVGCLEEGAAACEELLVNPQLPMIVKNLTLENRKFYERSK
jgi:hypothetical protein